MGNRLRTRLFTGPVLVLGLLGTVLLWAAPGMASPSPQTDSSDQSATSADQSTTTTTAPSDTASPITVHATCTREGRKLRINYTVRSWEPELTAPVVEVWFQVTGGRREPLPSGSFAPDQQEFSGHVLIDAPTEEGSTLEIIARAHWTDPTEKSLTKHSQPLPLPTCPAGVTTTQHRGRRDLHHLGGRGRDHHHGRRAAALHRDQLGPDGPGRRRDGGLRGAAGLGQPRPAPREVTLPPPTGAFRTSRRTRRWATPAGGFAGLRDVRSLI